MKIDAQRFKLKVRLNGSSQFEVFVTSGMLVSELKTIITSYTNIPPEQQKLICQGKLLKDELSMSLSKLSEGFVVQLSVQSQNPPEPDLSEPSPGRSRERFRVLDQSERYETIRQNIQGINLMFGSLISHPEEEILGFDNRERRFAVGQWVDVLDTVEQWLEAQILEIASTSQGTQVYVHYSGWPSQWDEWIDASSSRIQPLHSFTSQSITAPMHSPHPTVPIDIDIDNESLHAQAPADPKAFLVQGGEILHKIKGMLDRYYNTSVTVKHEKLGEKIADLRTHLGIVHNEESKEWASDTESMNAATLGLDDRESIASSEFNQYEHCASMEAALNMLTVQIAPLLDRSGRLLTDLATLIPNPATPLMPSPSELSLLTSPQRGDSGIHMYAFLVPSRRNN